MSPLNPEERKRLQSLLTKKGRRREKLFMAEGIRLLEESARYKRLPQAIYFTPSGLTERAELLLGKMRKWRVPLLSVSAKDLNRLSDTETSQGLIGIFKIPDSAPEKTVRPGPGRILLMDNISDPGNAGTLIRSALAFGFNPVLVTSNTVEPYNPKVVRSSSGAIFGVAMAETEPADLTRLKRESGYELWVADISGESLTGAIIKMPGKEKIILAVGSEATGPTPPIMKLADRKIRIGHTSLVESLNAAVAGSIIMQKIYEINIESEK
ncbi:putative tRNA/rRNA methyltransferase (SpoU) [Candidatus Zixiibacteriota bacterium]|nr:putative tRNA/rRNA methyltransferase (SpoU) [candidate division Zixibacteria bacterium]